MAPRADMEVGQLVGAEKPWDPCGERGFNDNSTKTPKSAYFAI